MVTFIFAILAFLITGIIFLGALVTDDRSARNGSIIWGTIILLVSVGLLVGSMVAIVPSGHVGVKIVFGNVNTEKSLGEGLHFVAPWEKVHSSNVRLQDYTMTNRTKEGEKIGDDSLLVKSSDGLNINMTLTVQYRVDPKKAPDIYQRLGPKKMYQKTFIRPSVRDVIRNVTSEYKGQDIYGVKRNKVRAEIYKRVKEDMSNKGFICDSVRLRKVDPPKDVSVAVQKKIAAKEEIKQKEYEVKSEKMEAERKRVEAKGLADSMDILSESLTPEYLQHEYLQSMQKLVGSPNTTFMLAPFDKSLTPMINLNKDNTGSVEPPSTDKNK